MAKENITKESIQELLDKVCQMEFAFGACNLRGAFKLSYLDCEGCPVRGPCNAATNAISDFANVLGGMLYMCKQKPRKVHKNKKCKETYHL